VIRVCDMKFSLEYNMAVIIGWALQLLVINTDNWSVCMSACDLSSQDMRCVIRAISLSRVHKIREPNHRGD
jgi:hypothetical protein